MVGLLLTGCSREGGSLFGATLASFLPGHADVSGRAAEIEYASLDLSVGRQGGLVVLAEIAGNDTYWQSGGDETIVLHEGYLSSTSGLGQDLHLSQVLDMDGDEPPWRTVGAGEGTRHYRVERSWDNKQGQRVTDEAAARFECRARTERRKLPLTTLDLQRCTETLRWDGGRTTRSVLWRAPDTGRVWAARVVAWPGAPMIAWQVARPWW